MNKQIMLLGLLLEEPMYGQQIREVIENHHALFADFIKNRLSTTSWSVWHTMVIWKCAGKRSKLLEQDQPTMN